MQKREIPERVYTQPQLTGDIAEYQNQIKKDYIIYATELNFLPHMQFDAVVARLASLKSGYDIALKENQKQLMAHLDTQKITQEVFDDIVQIFVAIWNYFPNAMMKGSPIEALREHLKKHPEKIDEYVQKEGEDSVTMVLKHAFKVMKIIEEIYYKQLMLLLKEVGGINKDAKIILDILQDPSADTGGALAHLAKVCNGDGASNRAVKETYELHEVQDIVRIISALEWYAVATIGKGQMTTRLFQSLIDGVLAKHVAKREKVAPDVMVAEAGVQYQRVVQILASVMDICTPFYKAEAVGLVEFLDAVRHMVLWAAIIDMSLLEKHDDSHEAAAIMLMYALYIAREVQGGFDIGITEEALWESCKKHVKSKKFESIHVRTATFMQYNEAILCQCADPLMMVPDVNDIDDSMYVKIKTIAPCMQWQENEEYAPGS